MSESEKENYANRVMDKVGVMSVEDSSYPDEEHITTVSVEYLKSAITILDELGWNHVDIHAVPPQTSEPVDEHPMLMLRTPGDSFFAGPNAGIGICPRTVQGRKKEMSDD